MRENLKRLANELRDPEINERFQAFVIAGAINSYYRAVESAMKGKRVKDLDKNIETAKNIIEMFRSDDFCAFSTIDGEIYINRMRKKAGTEEYAIERTGD